MILKYGMVWSGKACSGEFRLGMAGELRSGEVEHCGAWCGKARDTRSGVALYGRAGQSEVRDTWFG